VVTNRTKQFKENLTYGLPEDEAVDIPGKHGQSERTEEFKRLAAPLSL
jgi:hypothetical protein